MLILTRMASPPDCNSLASIYPPNDSRTAIGQFLPQMGNFTCLDFFRSDVTVNLGEIDKTWCKTIILDNGNIRGKWARAGLYYYCGGYRLFVNMPTRAKGLCAMVRLGAPLVLVREKGQSKTVMQKVTPAQLMTRRRRHVLGKKKSLRSFHLTKDSVTYIDSGYHRGSLMNLTRRSDSSRI